MARGYPGAFGGKTLNRTEVWLGPCAVFLLGLIDWRRLRSLRTLDLLVLLSFSVSLWFFNRGDVFESMSLVYPVFAYLLARMVWVGLRGRSPSRRAAFWLVCARGRDRLPRRLSDRPQPGGLERDRRRLPRRRRRAPNRERGDAVRPHAPPGEAEGVRTCGTRRARSATASRPTGAASRRTSAATPTGRRPTSPTCPVICCSDEREVGHASRRALHVDRVRPPRDPGLALVGRRFGGLPLAATLAFAWAAYPFTQYVSNSNTNDAIPPVLLIWGFWLVSSPWARGARSPPWRAGRSSVR